MTLFQNYFQTWINFYYKTRLICQKCLNTTDSLVRTESCNNSVVGTQSSPEIYNFCNTRKLRGPARYYCVACIIEHNQHCLDHHLDKFLCSICGYYYSQTHQSVMSLLHCQICQNIQYSIRNHNFLLKQDRDSEIRNSEIRDSEIELSNSESELDESNQEILADDLNCV